MSTPRTAAQIEQSWAQDPRWRGVTRRYAAADVVRLRGTVHVEHSLARMGAERLSQLLQADEPVRALGALTGNQAVEMVAAGLQAIYLSGWQVAADANTAGQMYPDQSLYPADSVPAVVRRINHALQRADQIAHLNDRDAQGNGRGERATIDWFVPLVADAEAGVHFEDQLASAKKCGHMGGKVLVPTREFVQKLAAARLAADVLDVPTLLIARTDANSAKLLTSDIDPRDHGFLTGQRTPEGFFELRGGLEAAIARGVAYAPYADLIWCETASPDLVEARRFADSIHQHHPGKLLAYNCSPSFNWSLNLGGSEIARFQAELGAMGYAFQFVTLAGFHSLNLSMFELASGYRDRGMDAYAILQDREFELQKSKGYGAVKHQAFVGTGYFDEVAKAISAGESSTAALRDSTEEKQF